MDNTFGWSELANLAMAVATVVTIVVMIMQNRKKHKELIANLLKNQAAEFEKEKVIKSKFDGIQQTVTNCQTAHNAQSMEKFNRFERELELEKEQNKATNDKLADSIINLKKEMNTKFDNMSESIDDRFDNMSESMTQVKDSIRAILEFLEKPAVLSQVSKAKTTIRSKK